MLRGNYTGKFVSFYDGAESSLLSADIALIDSGEGSHDTYPYASTAVVADNYDEMNLQIHAQTLPSGNKVAFGVFLSADLEKRSLLFRCSGAICIDASTGEYMVYPLFGRTDASTVTSTKAGTANLLDKWIILPNFRGHTGAFSSCSFNEDVYGKYLSDGEIWCIAWVIENISGGDITSLRVSSNLEFQKLANNLEVFKPDRI